LIGIIEFNISILQGFFSRFGIEALPLPLAKTKGLEENLTNLRFSEITQCPKIRLYSNNGIFTKQWVGLVSAPGSLRPGCQ
jgi:hypothetical protein